MENEERCQCLRPDLWDTGDFLCCFSCGLAPLGTATFCDRKAEQNEIIPDNNEQPSLPPQQGVPFVYKQLKQPTEFRLLRLFPGCSSDDIVCEIFHADICDPPVYQAVSYTWGDTTLACELQTTAGLMKITRNCLSALKGIRHVKHMLVLWVDAICISQANNSEKNHQIPLMGRIYAQAEEVLIFLGHNGILDMNATEILFECLRRGAKLRNPFTHGRQIAKLLSLPWFSRIWVLQEVAMARRAVVVFGHSFLEWRYLSIGNIHAIGMDSTNIAGEVPPVLRMSINDEKPVKDIPSFIEMARSCLSSDPRDRFYALLGLVHERAGIDLAPDYTKTTKEVYTDVTVQFLKKYNCLQFLSDIERYDLSLPNNPFDLQANIFNYTMESSLQALKCEFEHISSMIYQGISRSNGTLSGDMMNLVLFDKPEFPHKRFHTLRSLTEKLFLNLKRKGHMPIGMLPPLDTFPAPVAEEVRIRSSFIIEKWPDFPADVKELCKSKLELCKSWESKLKTLADTFAFAAYGALMWGKTAGQKYKPFHRSDNQSASRPTERKSVKTISGNLELPTWVPDYRHRPKLSSFAHWRPNTFPRELIARLRVSSVDHNSPILEVKAVIIEKVTGIGYTPTTSVRLCGNEILSTIGFEDHFTQSLMTINHGADFSDIVQFSQGRRVAPTDASLAIVPQGFDLGDVIAVIYGGTVPYLLRPTTSEPDRFQFIGECYLHGVRGSQFAPNYAELLGWFKDRVMDQGEQDDLPWRTIFLE